MKDKSFYIVIASIILSVAIISAAWIYSVGLANSPQNNFPVNAVQNTAPNTSNSNSCGI